MPYSQVLGLRMRSLILSTTIAPHVLKQSQVIALYRSTTHTFNVSIKLKR
ncbi:hypothetical protein [Altericista sp. CCNU0014]